MAQYDERVREWRRMARTAAAKTIRNDDARDESAGGLVGDEGGVGGEDKELFLTAGGRGMGGASVLSSIEEVSRLGEGARRVQYLRY